MDFRRVTQEEREHLYEEVWAEPVTTVASRYNMSDTALRKHCKRLWIPLPPRGYWEKVRAGQIVAKSRLPAVKDELKQYVYAYAIKYRALDEMTDHELETAEGLSLFTDETIALINETSTRIEVKHQLRNPHPLITEHKEESTYRKKRDKELKKAEFNQHYYLITKSKYRENKATLPVSVSEANVNRCYRILDALFKALDPMEGSVSVGLDSGLDVGRLYIPHSSFEFQVKEKKRPKTRKSTTRPPRLVLSQHTTAWCYDKNARHDLEYKDKADRLLESQLGEIVLEMYATAAKVMAQEQLGNREMEREFEERRQKEHLEKMRKGEVEELKVLEQAAADSERAQRIRQLALAVEVAIEGVSEPKEKKQLLTWLKWSRDKADWLDPLTEKEDELLGKSNHLFDKILGR